MLFKSFSARLLALFLALLAVTALIVFHEAVSKSERELMREYTERGQKNLDVVQWLLAEKGPYDAQHGGVDALRARVAELSGKLGVRITYISGGKVLAESNLPPADAMKMDDHSTRPEVVDAMKNGFGFYPRYSTTLGKDLFYLAKRIQGVANLPDGVLRIAEPYSVVQTVIEQSRKDTRTLVIVMTACAAALAIILMLRARRELSDFVGQVERAGQDAPVPDKLRVYPGQEFKPLADSINSLAKKARRSMRRLHDAQAQLEAVLANMTDAVAILDHDGSIMLGNAALEAMLGKEGQLPSGKDALEAGLGAQVFRAVVTALKEEEPAPLRIQTRLASGVHADVDLIPYSTVKGKRRFILVLHDVTAMTDAQALLREFVIDASHRLRTPLTSIQGYAATLLDSPVGEQDMAGSMLRVVVQKSDAMSEVITELLHRMSPQVGRSGSAQDGAALAGGDPGQDGAASEARPEAR